MAGAETLVEFTRELREEGLSVGSTTAADLMTALERVGWPPPADVHAAFRCLTVSSPWQLDIFDRVFVRFFGRNLSSGIAMASRPNPARGRSAGSNGEERKGTARTPIPSSRLHRGFLGGAACRKDFSELTKIEQAQVRNLVVQMMWRPAPVKSRRRRPSPRGDRPDLRRTLRKCVGPEGDMIKLESSERRTRPRPILFIAGRVGLHGALHRDAALFRARRPRPAGENGDFCVLHPPDPHHTPPDAPQPHRGALPGLPIGGRLVGGHEDRRVSAHVHYDWSRRVTRGGPVALIISDGWDRGDPEMLSREMERLRRTVHRLIWVNPLASREGFSPETRGMRAALPHVDDFLAGGRLSDLATLVSLLESLPERKK